MTAHEIFSRIPAAQASDIFTWLHDKEKKLYKATLEALAKQRHLRAVFVERKPRGERHAWIHEALGRKANDDVSAQILQIWVVGEHSKLPRDFLDLLGIKHDDNGTVDELPAEPAPGKLKPAVDALLEKHEPSLVVTYLHAFHALNDQGWQTLGALLEEDDRLKIGPAV
ncbi:MAG: hypothetical protein WCH43_06715 [Verrucomicrobiota bacterium]